MIRPVCIAAALVALPLLSGCVRTATSIVTAPVRVVGKTADWATTSQSEADRNRGRKMRKRDDQISRIDRQYQKNMRDCQNGVDDACERAREQYAEIQNLRAAPM